MNISKTFVFSTAIILFFCFTSCKQKIGEYAYIDSRGILHTDKHCNAIVGTASSYSFREDDVYEMAHNNNQFENLICKKCVNEENQRIIVLAMELYDEEKIKTHNEYLALCLLGKDRWKNTFDDYYAYIKSGDNRKQLSKELRNEGYDFDDLRFAISKVDDYCNETTHNEPVKVKWNEKYRMYLYFILSVGDSIGSYNEFKERLENSPEDFTYCYYKCKTLGIVDSWHDFIMQIFAPNCEECREELEEELSRYEDEKNDYYEEMNDYYIDHNMDNHH